MKINKKNKIIVTAVVVLALTIWVTARWKAWFNNPPEEPYTISNVPQRLLLTFGNGGEMTRFVSWTCGDSVDPNAHLLLTDGKDTTRIKATGEVFESRAGTAAYYRAEMTALRPMTTYSYAAVSKGKVSAWHTFSTHDPAAEDFAFLFMGDVQDSIGGVANTLLRKAIKRHPEVEFVAFGGDLCERPANQYWEETFRSIDSICTAMPVINITGNHDYFKGVFKSCEHRFELIFPYFLKGMAERDDENHIFTLRYHNTDIMMLDSDRGIPYLYAQRQWLSDALAASTARHRIVMLHHPLFSVKKPNNNIIQRWMFNDLITDNAVDLVMQGHEHAYTRCTDSETPLNGNTCKGHPLYTISHCSPKNYSIHPTERFKPVLSGSRYYQVVRVSRNDITMLAFDANSGERVDSVRIVNHSVKSKVKS